MARINWRTNAKTIQVPPEIDWTDPTHAPLMAGEAVWQIGNDLFCFDEAEYLACVNMAIDLMPLGKEAVLKGVKEMVYGMAAADGWLEHLFDPGTNRYPGEET